MMKQILRYEWENRDKMVIHLIISKDHVDLFDEGVQYFLTWSSDVLSGIFCQGTSMIEVIAANLEMADDQARAHWHAIFYTSESSQEKLREFMSTKTNVAAYLAVCYKKQLGLRFGVDVKEIKKMKGVSIIKPEVKKMSQIDYMIKDGVNNLMVLGLPECGDDFEFDIWSSKALSEFYRKNCTGVKPEGGVRALFPGRQGPLGKRVDKDDIDIEEIVGYFIEKGDIPSEESFRLYMYRNHGNKTINKQHYALVRELVVESIGSAQLKNPREKIVGSLTTLSDCWLDWCKVFLSSKADTPQMFRRQYSYMVNAMIVLNSDYIRQIYQWCSKYLVVSQEVRDGQKNKALVLEGTSNSGKSALMELLFPPKVFGTRGLTMDIKYATHGMYNPACHLWIYRDINRGLSIDNMFRFQNIIDGDETLREINKPEMQSIYPSRPIIAATTTHLVESFNRRTDERSDLRTRVEQFINRLVIVQIPSSVQVASNGVSIDKSPLLKFLTLTKYFDVPEWMPYYLFWRFYFRFEGEYSDGEANWAYIDDILSLCEDVPVVDQNVIDFFELESAPTPGELDLSHDRLDL